MEPFDGRCEAAMKNKPNQRCPNEAKGERDGHAVCGMHVRNKTIRYTLAADRFRKMVAARDAALAAKACTHVFGLALVHNQKPAIAQCTRCKMYLDIDLGDPPARPDSRDGATL